MYVTVSFAISSDNFCTIDQFVVMTDFATHYLILVLLDVPKLRPWVRSLPLLSVVSGCFASDHDFEG